MKLVRNLKSQLLPLSLTIGNFDGLHLGHLKIIEEVKKIAKEKNLASAILTFEPHPISFLRPDLPRDFSIFSLAQKLKIFRESEIDYAIVLPFNREISEISARDFVEKILLQKLNIKHLTIGYDFTFGKNREGNFKLLEEESSKNGFELTEISVIKNSNQTCSSSLIRRLLTQGSVKDASEILGKNFAISGLVNEGRKLANQLGFPTANLIAKPKIIKPKFGVYKTLTTIPHLNKKFSSITNFGIKPTLENKEQKPLFETHISDFSQNIYGKKIIVEFVDFIRDEQKFSSLQELKEQIKKDLEKIK
jgi:riboflavin kinase/FMN adenylyltransferase